MQAGRQTGSMRVSDDELHAMAAACYEASQWWWPEIITPEIISYEASRSQVVKRLHDADTAGGHALDTVVKRRRALTLAD